ncbi:MAG: 2Fe-2S iron-sulfur cluster-binding protein, partial [Armatimonadaceae bacterium]
MPKLTVEGFGTYDVPEGKKLVLAIEDSGVDILHRCGGVPACTTCKVEILEGTVGPMSQSEEEALEEPELIEKYRLSCQV